MSEAREVLSLVREEVSKERMLCAKDVCVACRSVKLFKPAAYINHYWRHAVIGTTDTIRCQAEEIWIRAGRSGVPTSPTTGETPKDGWTRCAEKVPEQYTTVIAYTAPHNPNSDGYEIFFFRSKFPERVTHWCNLPAPPAGEKVGE
jgi:hypothetical protein